MPKILIQNGRVIDPSQEMDRVTNLLVEEGKVVAYDVEPTGDESQVIDAHRQDRLTRLDRYACASPRAGLRRC